MVPSLRVVILALCALLEPTVTQQENFYSREYSQGMLRKLESEIFAKTSPLLPTDYLMLYVIELKQGMNALNDTVSNIGREYHDLWKQEVDKMAVTTNTNSAQCTCNSSNSEEVKKLHEKVDAIRGDVQRVLEELQNMKNTQIAAAGNVQDTPEAGQAGPPEKEEEASETVKNYTGHSSWRNVKRSLEYVLDPSSEAYRQLKDIGAQETAPLKSVAERGYAELLGELLDRGLPADTLADDVWRYDLLSAAAMSGQVVVAEMLLARGAHTDATNNRGVTPLMFAASKNHLAVVKALVRAGADLGRKNYDGNTALDLARKRGNHEVVGYLQEFEQHQTAQQSASR